MEGSSEKKTDRLAMNDEERQIAETDQVIAQLKGQCSGDSDLLRLVQILQLINKRQECKYKVSQQKLLELKHNCDSYKKELTTLKDQDLMKNGEVDAEFRLKRNACPIVVPEHSKRIKKKSPSVSEDSDSDEEFLKPVAKIKLKRTKIITKCDYEKEIRNLKSSFERSQNLSDTLNEEQRQVIDEQRTLIDNYLNDSKIESIMLGVDKLILSNPSSKKQASFLGKTNVEDIDNMTSILMAKEEQYMKVRQSKAELENLLKIRDDELQQLRKDLNDKCHTLGLRDQEIATLAEDMTTKDNTIKELEARIKTFENEKRSLCEELSKNEAESSENLLLIEKERAEKAKLEQKCSKYTDYIKDKKKEQEDLEEKISKLQSENEKYKYDNKAKESENEKYRNDNKDKDGKIQKLEEQINQMDYSVTGLAEAMMKHKTENLELKKQLEEMKKTMPRQS